MHSSLCIHGSGKGGSFRFGVAPVTLWDTQSLLTKNAHFWLDRQKMSCPWRLWAVLESAGRQGLCPYRPTFTNRMEVRPVQIQLTTEEVERFWSHVDRCGGPNACHPWTSYRTDCEDGYGLFRTGGKLLRAHRIAWCLAGNEITEDKPHVLHNCPGGDLKACCNDRHLWAGTNTENARDKARKNQGPKSRQGLPFGVLPRPSGRFGAQLRVNGKQMALGTYDTPEEASAVALDARQRFLEQFP